MLRNRTRTVTTKQALMADQTPPSSLSSSSPPSPNQTSATSSSILNSPRLLFSYWGFQKGPPIEVETMSPTSILDIKQFSPIFDNKSKNPNIFSGNKHKLEHENQERIGLALIGALNNEKVSNNYTIPNSRKVLFGSNLKIQIPQIPPFSPTQSPESPGDFGTKTRNSPFGYSNSNTRTRDFNSPRVFDPEMELSEEYTRVIAHGPSPRTVHIYDDCVLESCKGVIGLSELKKEQSPLSMEEKWRLPSESFLSFCCTCKKSLEQGKDIYMYRGEKGFCSHECRCKEMLSDGEDDLV